MSGQKGIWDSSTTSSSEDEDISAGVKKFAIRKIVLPRVMRAKRVIPCHPSDVWDVSSSSEPDEELEQLKDRIRSEEARYQQSAKKKGQ